MKWRRIWKWLCGESRYRAAQDRLNAKAMRAEHRVYRLVRSPTTTKAEMAEVATRLDQIVIWRDRLWALRRRR